MTTHRADYIYIHPPHVFPHPLWILGTVLKYTEDFLDVQGFIGSREVFDDIESNSLCKWAALSNGHQVTFLDIDEAWGSMHSHVTVTLFKSSIFSDVL